MGVINDRQIRKPPGSDENIALYKASKLDSPFNYIIIDDFLEAVVLNSVQDEFPHFDDPVWHVYDNPVEKKKTTNNWNQFKPATYSLLHYLSSPEFVVEVSKLTGYQLHADPGLHGGGLHAHGQSGKLNPHLDYKIHPKLQLERRINLIIYIHPNYNEEQGGHLGLWDHDPLTNSPGLLKKEIAPLTNRAILFDTSQNSWHGISRELNSCTSFVRKSIAAYYLSEQNCKAVDLRHKALYAPIGEQRDNPEIIEFIKRRADAVNFSSAYRTSE
jgi:Rps23 Pro-64 3,4-dihydroxylase Tpa1-like proline 4-hydroxylase